VTFVILNTLIVINIYCCMSFLSRCSRSLLPLLQFWFWFRCIVNYLQVDDSNIVACHSCLIAQDRYCIWCRFYPFLVSDACIYNEQGELLGQNNRCLNNGLCMHGTNASAPGNYTCDCTLEYVGQYCEQGLDTKLLSRVLFLCKTLNTRDWQCHGYWKKDRRFDDRIWYT